MAHLHEVFFFFIRVIAMYASSPVITAKSFLQRSKYAFLRDSCQKKKFSHKVTWQHASRDMCRFTCFFYLIFMYDPLSSVMSHFRSRHAPTRQLRQATAA